MDLTDIDRLTLGELRAIAERADETLVMLQRVRGLLSGAAQPGVAVNAGQPLQQPQTQALTKPPSVLTPEQQADLSAWKNSPARMKLVEQAKGTPDDLPPSISAAEKKEEAKIFGKEWGQ